MFSRVSTIPLVLATAVGVPYLVSHAPEGVTRMWQTAGEQSGQVATELSRPQLPPRKFVDAPPSGPGSELYPVNTPLEGAGGISLEEVFRFDVTKEWVYQHWARKSTALADLNLYGVRVPLVTGTQLDDVAGSLTYFFDQAGRIQRISFHGQTGDTTRLVMLAVHRFGLQLQPTVVSGEQLYQRKNDRGVLSQLHTHPSAVLWSSSPHNSFDVALDIQAPGTTTPLPSKLPPLAPQKSPGPQADQQKTAEELTPEEEAKMVAERQRQKRKELDEKMKAFFPRSRVPQPQVKSLDKRDLYW